LKASDGDLFVNDDSREIIPDIDASDGAIHAADTMIVGPRLHASE
jgi:hypothetical protein